MGKCVVFATHSADAAADLEELQLINMSLSNTEKARSQFEASRCFQMHLAIGTRGQALSQGGLLDVDFTLMEFRA